MTNTNEIARDICREVAELPDRTRPEDMPEMMLVTEDELYAISAAAIDQAVEQEREACAGIAEGWINLGNIGERVTPAKMAANLAKAIRNREG